MPAVLFSVASFPSKLTGALCQPSHFAGGVAKFAANGSNHCSWMLTIFESIHTGLKNAGTIGNMKP
jgi:hypothetical protein